MRAGICAQISTFFSLFGGFFVVHGGRLLLAKGKGRRAIAAMCAAHNNAVRFGVVF